tara:strand:+ start:2269 stop:2544 length:276 start_codon:yes stop_codon:yes gene_type:complete
VNLPKWLCGLFKHRWLFLGTWTVQVCDYEDYSWFDVCRGLHQLKIFHHTDNQYFCLRCGLVRHDYEGDWGRIEAPMRLDTREAWYGPEEME